jgi:hypothetical protein
MAAAKSMPLVCSQIAQFAGSIAQQNLKEIEPSVWNRSAASAGLP